MGNQSEHIIKLGLDSGDALVELNEIKRLLDNISKNTQNVKIDVDTKGIDAATASINKMMQALQGRKGDFSQFKDLGDQMEIITDSVMELQNAFGKLGDERGLKPLLSSINSIDNALTSLSKKFADFNGKSGNKNNNLGNGLKQQTDGVKQAGDNMKKAVDSVEKAGKASQNAIKRYNSEMSKINIDALNRKNNKDSMFGFSEEDSKRYDDLFDKWVATRQKLAQLKRDGVSSGNEFEKLSVDATRFSKELKNLESYYGKMKINKASNKEFIPIDTSGFLKVQKVAEETNQAINSIGTDAGSSMNATAAATNVLSDALQNVGQNAENTKKSIKEITNAERILSGQTKNLSKKNFKSGAEEIAQKYRNTRGNIYTRQAIEAEKNYYKMMDELDNSNYSDRNIKRIARETTKIAGTFNPYANDPMKNAQWQEAEAKKRIENYQKYQDEALNSLGIKNGDKMSQEIKTVVDNYAESMTKLADTKAKLSQKSGVSSSTIKEDPELKANQESANKATEALEKLKQAKQQVQDTPTVSKTDNKAQQEEIKNTKEQIKENEDLAKSKEKVAKAQKQTNSEAQKGQTFRTNTADYDLEALSKEINKTGRIGTLTNNDSGQLVWQEWDNKTKSIKKYAAAVTESGVVISKGYSDMAEGQKKASSSSQNFANSLQSEIARLVSFRAMVRYVKDSIKTVQEFNDSLSTISMTMDISKSGLNDLGNSIISSAKNTGASIKTVSSIAEIYANMNETADTIMNSANATIMLSNASGLDAKTTSDVIQGVINQYKDLAGSEEYVSDTLQNVSASLKMNFGSGIEYMSQAIQKSGSIAKEAGLSYEELIATTGVISEITRQTGDVTGNSVKFAA